MRLDAALCPARRARCGMVGVLIVCRIGDAFIESHSDIAPQILLRMNGNLRREELLRSIEEGTEVHALLCDLAHSSQREDLKAAAVRQYSLRPVHETMQLASLFDQLRAGTQEQMVGIREDDLRAHVFEFFGCDSLDCRLCADRHKHRRFERAMRRVQEPCPRTGLLVFGNQFVVNNHSCRSL